MKKLLLIGLLAGAALYVGGAAARPLPDDAEPIAKKKRADGGTRDEEKEEDFRRY